MIGAFILSFLHFLKIFENNNYMKKSKEFLVEEIFNSTSKESVYKGKDNDWEKQSKL